MTTRPLDSLRPTETLDIDNGLSLVPRIKLILTVHPSLHSSVTRPIDEWKLKRALIDFLKTSLSITVPEEDLYIKRFKDLKKHKRTDPIAHGTLCITDLGLLKRSVEKEDVKVLEDKFVEWRKRVVEKMEGIDLNLEGEKYSLSVSAPESDDFDAMKKSWEESYAFGNRSYYKGGNQEPDTIVIRGVPSRWFAETRVSSKPSLLVTHTIFSIFGKIRNLDVSEDNDQDKDTDDNGGAIISGLHCKIVVQFEKHKDFYNALRVLCGRSLQKQGSRLKADYEVTLAKNDYFRTSRNQLQEKSRAPVAQNVHRGKAPRREPYLSQSTFEDKPRKRFKE